MTKAEQEKHKSWRAELKEIRDKNDVLIFYGQVILRNEREKHAALFGGSLFFKPTHLLPDMKPD